MSHSSTRAALAGLLAVTLTGCAAGAPADKPQKPGPTAETSAQPEPEPSPTEPAVPTVAGLAPGEIPPIPLIQLPDLAMLDASLASFTIELAAGVGEIPGVSVEPTRCDASGEPEVGVGALWAYGDGSGILTVPGGQVVNYGDGSGTYSLNGVDVTVHGDGSGVYDDGTTSVVSYGDGSGVYDDGTTKVYVHVDGAGGWSRGDRSIVNHGDGGGTYSDGSVMVVNYGDGSGYYEDGVITVRNDGDGTASVDGVTVPADPLPPVPRLGRFPSMAAIAPVPPCGTRLTLGTDVLFDFGSAELRPEAAAALDALADALADVDVDGGSIEGHTDAISSDELNQRLSEARARAVADALAERGVDGFDVVGWGETRPVAPNEVDGQDNPAGRQLNRRVEILLPAS